MACHSVKVRTASLALRSAASLAVVRFLLGAAERRGGPDCGDRNVTLFLLTDRPEQAKFLTGEERAWLSALDPGRATAPRMATLIVAKPGEQFYTDADRSTSASFSNYGGCHARFTTLP
jgi:hypothetical protein